MLRHLQTDDLFSAGRCLVTFGGLARAPDVIKSRPRVTGRQISPLRFHRLPSAARCAKTLLASQATAPHCSKSSLFPWDCNPSYPAVPTLPPPLASAEASVTVAPGWALLRAYKPDALLQPMPGFAVCCHKTVAAAPLRHLPPLCWFWLVGAPAVHSRTSTRALAVPQLAHMRPQFCLKQHKHTVQWGASWR
jgi:hypothetical protein